MVEPLTSLIYPYLHHLLTTTIIDISTIDFALIVSFPMNNGHFP